MKGNYSYKVPGGKLVEVRVEFGELIEKVEILGDFFVYPEENLAGIESSLAGIPAGESEGSISEKISVQAASSMTELIGVTPDAIAHALRLAVGR